MKVRQAASIRNVTFSNIALAGSRNSGFSSDTWGAHPYCRAVHPEVPKKDYPVCEVKFVDIRCIASTYALITCLEQGRFILDHITPPPGGRVVYFNGHPQAPDNYLDCSLLLRGSTFAKTDEHGPGDIVVGPGVRLNMILESAMQERDIDLRVSQQSPTRVNGAASINGINNLTPAAGDSIKVQNVRQTFNGEKWMSN